MSNTTYDQLRHELQIVIDHCFELLLDIDMYNHPYYDDEQFESILQFNKFIADNNLLQHTKNLHTLSMFIANNPHLNSNLTRKLMYRTNPVFDVIFDTRPLPKYMKSD